MYEDSSRKRAFYEKNFPKKNDKIGSLLSKARPGFYHWAVHNVYMIKKKNVIQTRYKNFYLKFCIEKRNIISSKENAQTTLFVQLFLVINVQLKV